MIYTFYSFKGGVGRSMALANIAELLYRRGLKVLMMDFDLEAPGLERYFDVEGAAKLDDVLTQRGVIDLLLSYKELRSLPKLSPPRAEASNAEVTDTTETPAISGNDEPNSTPEEFPYSVEPLTNFIVSIYETSVTGGCLSLLPAGRRARKDDAGGRDIGTKDEFIRYAERVRSFNWDDFYANWDGELFFEWLRKEAEDKGLFDAVLIDSRTGVTEMSGVCTYQLADVVVLFVAANNQNIVGTKMMADNLANPLLISEGRKGRKLSLVFVPSRVEPFEETKIEKFVADFQENFGDLILASGLKFETSPFLDLKIPYTTGYAFKEDVAVREPTRTSAAELNRAFDRIASTLAQLEPKSSRLRKIFYPIERANIYISYTSGAELDQAIARQLAEALGKQHYVFFDQMITIGKSWADRLDSELHKADFLIVLLSRESTQSDFVATELATAHHLSAEQGRPTIIPVRLDYTEEFPERFGALLNHIRWFSWQSPDDTPRLIEELLRTIAAMSGTSVQQESKSSLGRSMAPAQDEGLESNFLLWRGELRLALSNWQRSNDDRDLLSGFSLVEAGNYLIERPADLSPAEQEYIQTGLVRQKRERQDARLSSPAQSSAFAGNMNSLKRAAIYSVVFLFALALITVLAWVVAHPRAPRFQDSTTRSRILAENSVSQLAIDPQLSLLLAIKSADTAQTPEAESAVRQSLYGVLANSGNTLIELRGHVSPLRSAEFSGDGKLVVTASTNGTARVWDSGTGVTQVTFVGHQATINCALFSPDRNFIATASRDSFACVWEIGTATKVARLSGHTDWVISARFSPDGKRIVTASFDNTARVWDLATQKMLHVLQHNGNVYNAEFDVTGQYIVTASEDGTACIWDASTGLKMITLVHSASLRDAVFSPKGNYVVTASTDKTARVWNAKTGELLITLAGHTDWVTHASFSPDEQFIVTASNDSTARVWETATGKTIAILRGHENWVSTANFSPDGKTIVTASRDKTARVWEAGTGVQIALLEGSTDSLKSARFDFDGHHILTAGDNTARIYSCRLCGSSEDLLTLARKNVTRELTAEEQKKYLP